MWTAEAKKIGPYFLFVALIATNGVTQEIKLDSWLPGLESMKEENLSVSNLIRKAEDGDANAALGLGFHFDNCMDITNAVKYLAIAANKGSAAAQYKLGCVLGSDANNTNRYNQASFWLKIAMTNGLEWEYLAKKRLGELDYEEGGGECLVSFNKAFEVLESVFHYCTFIQFGTEQADAISKIREDIDNIRNDRTVLRVLVLLTYFAAESKNENSEKYRKYLDCGIDACNKKLSQTVNGKKMLEEYKRGRNNLRDGVN